MASVVLVASVSAAGACGDDAERAVVSGSFCETIQELADLAATGGVGVEIDSSMSEEEQQARIEQAGAELRAGIDAALELFVDLEQRAPDELADDVELVVADFRRLYTEMQADVDDPLEAMGLFGSFEPEPGVPAAIDRIDAYAEGECGVGFALADEITAEAGSRPPPPPPTPPTPPPPTPPEPPPAPGYGY